MDQSSDRFAVSMRFFLGIVGDGDEGEAEWSSIGTHPSVRSCLLRARRAEKVSQDPTGAGEGGANPSEADGTALHFGLSICRGPLQPFPWVSSVAIGGPAEEAGLAAGDCLLCVRHTNLFGLPVSRVARALAEAALPRAGCQQPVELLYWRPPPFEGGSEVGGGPSHSFAHIHVTTPSYENIQTAEMTRISKKLKEVLTTITCPVCCERPIPKPATQCTNGHLLCLRCRRRSARCPVCRVPLRTSSGVPLGGRCLLADQILAALAPEDEVRTSSAHLRTADGSSPAEIGRRDERRGQEAIHPKRRGGAKAIVRGFTSWLLEARRERRSAPESLNEGDIYRLCAAM